MQSQHDDLRLWYGTPDAPAPPDLVRAFEPAMLLVGVAPVGLANQVAALVRVDGGSPRVIQGGPLPFSPGDPAQYFRVPLPAAGPGSTVEYAPMLTGAGRMIPVQPGEYPARYQVASAQPATPPASAPARADSRVPDFSHATFTPALTHLTTARIGFKRPQFLGRTPAGLRINFFAIGGRMDGPVLNGNVRENSADYMLVREDGMGLIDVQGTVDTDDGAILSTAYMGLIDFGEDGQARLLAGTPERYARLQIVPRYLSAAPGYRWMNRTQFMGVGQADMVDKTITYDLYAVATVDRNPQT